MRSSLSLRTAIVCAILLLTPASGLAQRPGLNLQNLKVAYEVLALLRSEFITSGKPMVHRPTGVESGAGIDSDKLQLFEVKVTVETHASNSNTFRTHTVYMTLPVAARYSVSWSALGKNVRRGLANEIIVTLPTVNYELIPSFAPGIFEDGFQGFVIPEAEGESKQQLREQLQMPSSWEPLARAEAEKRRGEATAHIRSSVQEHLQRILAKVDPSLSVRVE
jgi:hypothetical protein